MKLWYDDYPKPREIVADIIGMIIRAAVVLTLLYAFVCIVLSVHK